MRLPLSAQAGRAGRHLGEQAARRHASKALVVGRGKFSCCVSIWRIGVLCLGHSYFRFARRFVFHKCLFLAFVFRGVEWFESTEISEGNLPVSKMIRFPRYTALEFFAGIGMARDGLQAAGVSTIWANDVDEMKCSLYKAQWGAQDLHCANVFDVNADDVPYADIAWASSPCTDLSLAGKREGLVDGAESSAFFGFVDVLNGMKSRKPAAIVLENVCGLASSHDGRDFRQVIEEFNKLGYSCDAFELNARRWLPQSRPRLFVVGLQNPIDGGTLDSSARPDRLAWIHCDSSLRTHVTPLSDLPEPLTSGLTDLVEKIPDDDERWWDQKRVDSFVESLSSVQKRRLDDLKASKRVRARTAYRRTRKKKSVWEMRDDDIAGCLRTSRGGSSRQAVVFLGNDEIKIRWMTGNEYALLQGAHGFRLEGFRESQIQYAFGDAVASPVVAWLVKEAILPALSRSARETGFAHAS